MSDSRRDYEARLARLISSARPRPVFANPRFKVEDFELPTFEPLAFVRPAEPTNRPLLTDRQQEAYDWIKENGPAVGKEIATGVGMDVDQFYKEVAPALKKIGVENKRGRGYYIPGVHNVAVRTPERTP